MPAYNNEPGYSGDIQDFTGDTHHAYIVYSKFDWCQIRQAFAEELYAAYREPKIGEFGTANWIDAYKEGQLVSEILKSNYSDKDKPMFLGGEIDEIDWDGMWCIAWWYARHAQTDRADIRNHLSTSIYPIDLFVDKNSISFCREKAFYREERHNTDPNCIPIPRGWGEKILAILGGAALGGIGLVTVIWLVSDSKSNK